MELSEIIIQRISAQGPLSFHDFMEMCLYYPGKGYYTSSGDKIGKNGDYYTSSNITSLFGAMIGKQLEEMWTIMDKKEFCIVEYGAGTGMLCRDIISYVEKNDEFLSKLRYCIVERSPTMRERESGRLDGKVCWYDSIIDIGAFTGCILSNEVVDNFSIHQVVMKAQLMEVFVDYRNGFVEVLRPAEKKLADYLAQLHIRLPKDFRTEINMEAVRWMREIAKTLKKGYVLTIDYGYPSLQLYSQCRSNGTLLCYSKHTVNDHPYENIGGQDITSHINFSALSYWGGKWGLTTSGLTSQASFLRSLGLERFLHETYLQQKDYMRFREYAFLKYALLFDMGQKFKVLIQSKNVPSIQLSGLLA